MIILCNKYPSNLLSFSLEHKQPFMQKKFLILCPDRVVAKIHTQEKSFNRKNKIGRKPIISCSGSQPARVVSRNSGVLSWTFWWHVMDFCFLGHSFYWAAEGLVPKAGVRGKCQGTCHFKVRIPRYDWGRAENSARTSGQWCVQLSELKRLSG